MSLKQFGALGDGKTEESNIINIAFTKTEGHVLYVPTGTYIIGNRINTVNKFLVLLTSGYMIVLKKTPKGL